MLVSYDIMLKVGYSEENRIRTYYRQCDVTKFLQSSVYYTASLSIIRYEGLTKCRLSSSDWLSGKRK